jgi:hypothetical protein
MPALTTAPSATLISAYFDQVPPYPVLFAAADLDRSAQREPRSLCGVERCRLHPAREVRPNLSKSSCAGSVLPLGILGGASVGFL